MIKLAIVIETNAKGYIFGACQNESINPTQNELTYYKQCKPHGLLDDAVRLVEKNLASQKPPAPSITKPQ